MALIRLVRIWMKKDDLEQQLVFGGNIFNKPKCGSVLDSYLLIRDKFDYGATIRGFIVESFGQ